MFAGIHSFSITLRRQLQARSLSSSARGVPRHSASACLAIPHA